MPEAINLVNEVIDQEHGDKSATTRRRMIAGTTALLGSWGLLNTGDAMAKLTGAGYRGPNTPENILNTAATAEVLATIVNTVGYERVALDDVTKANIAAAAREELVHYQVLTSSGVGAKPATTRIWVPDKVFADRESFLTALAVGDQIFCNAYLLGVTVFARPGGTSNARLARYAAEFMGVEAVHRALALQSLGRLGNDRAFVRFSQREETYPGAPNKGFTDIRDAAKQLQAAGFGFGAAGATPGRFYEFGDVSKRTPDPAGVNTRTPA
jgi:hypothetical protein